MIDLGWRRFSAALLITALAGCAMPPGSVQSGDTLPGDKRVDQTRVDRWDVAQGSEFANAAVMAQTRDAILLVGCAEGERSVGIYVDPERKIPGSRRTRAITASYDGGAPEALDWLGLEEIYATDDARPGFQAAVDDLKTHKEVEFVITDSGNEVMRNRFSLNGAAGAIETVIAACSRF